MDEDAFLEEFGSWNRSQKNLLKKYIRELQLVSSKSL